MRAVFSSGAGTAAAGVGGGKWRRALACSVLALTALYVVVCCRWWLLRAVAVDRAPLWAGGSAGSGDVAAASDHLRVRRELGHGTWNMLHRMVAQFPKTPSAENATLLVGFFDAFARLYPCEECAEHFRAMLAANPVDTSSNAAASLWLCRLHNNVNVRLGKPLFPCTLEELAKAYGSCGCFETSDDGGDKVADGEGGTTPMRGQLRQQAI